MIDPLKVWLLLDNLFAATIVVQYFYLASIFLDISGNSRSVLIHSQVLVVAISICVIKTNNLVLFVTGKHFQLSLLT
jgi:hypothetical protein